MKQGQTIIKQCEATADQLHIHLWTIVVKALVLSQPSTFEQYIPKVKQDNLSISMVFSYGKF